MKKLFLSITTLALVIFLSLGCVTKQVWTDKVKSDPYQERIISFYNNPEEGKIIFIGEKYHYIFDKGAKEFSKFIEAKKRLNLKEKHLEIYASTDRFQKEKVLVHLGFTFKKDNLTQEQKSWLEQHNKELIKIPNPIEKNPNDNRPVVYEPNQTQIESYIVNYQLSGKRYKATPQVNSQVVKLKNPINIEVIEYRTEKKSMLYKIAMTPLSVTADAGLVIIGAGAAVIFLPIALIGMEYQAITK